MIFFLVTLCAVAIHMHLNDYYLTCMYTAVLQVATC